MSNEEDILAYQREFQKLFTDEATLNLICDSVGKVLQLTPSQQELCKLALSNFGKQIANTASPAGFSVEQMIDYYENYRTNRLQEAAFAIQPPTHILPQGVFVVDGFIMGGRLTFPIPNRQKWGIANEVPVNNTPDPLSRLYGIDVFSDYADKAELNARLLETAKKGPSMHLVIQGVVNALIPRVWSNMLISQGRPCHYISFNPIEFYSGYITTFGLKFVSMFKDMDEALKVILPPTPPANTTIVVLAGGIQSTLMKPLLNFIKMFANEMKVLNPIGNRTDEGSAANFLNKILTKEFNP